VSRHWQFDWRLLLFSGLLLPVLLSLGVWQLDRAAQKQALLASWATGSHGASWGQAVTESLSRGQPVSLRGRYTGQSWLLDNRTRDGRPGYEVLTLFIPMEGPRVVINRGWVPAPRTRAQLPGVTAPEGLLTLKGRLDHYPEPPVLGQQAEPAEGWPVRVQTLPREVVARHGGEVADMVLKLAGQEQPGAFRADHEPDVMAPQTHYGYAAQWFALAAALTILTLVASYKNNNDPRR